MRGKIVLFCLLAGSILSAAPLKSYWIQHQNRGKWDIQGQWLDFGPGPLATHATKTLKAWVQDDTTVFLTIAKKDRTSKPRDRTPYFLDLDANIAHTDSQTISIWYERYERRGNVPGNRKIFVFNFAMQSGKPEKVPATRWFGSARPPSEIEQLLLAKCNEIREMRGEGEWRAIPSELWNQFTISRSGVTWIIPSKLLGSMRDELDFVTLSMTELKPFLSDRALLKSWQPVAGPL